MIAHPIATVALLLLAQDAAASSLIKTSAKTKLLQNAIDSAKNAIRRRNLSLANFRAASSSSATLKKKMMIGAHRDRELQEADSGAPEEPMNVRCHAFEGYPVCRDDGEWCDGSYDCTSNMGLCDCDAGSNFCAGGINPCLGVTGESEPGCHASGYPACRGDGSWCDGTSYDCAREWCDCDAGSNFCAGGINPCFGVTGESEPVLDVENVLDVGNIEVDGPCLICKDGITVNEFYWWTVDEEDCKTVEENYKDFAAEGSELCKLAEDSYQMMCCPTPPENPCVCPNGVTATTISDALMNAMTDDEMEFEFSLDEECSIVPILQQFEADSDECEPGDDEEIEAFCCPTTPKNPCSMCPNTGITVDSNDCAFSLEISKVLEADTLICKEIQFEEAFCCPTLAKTPCSLCQDNDSFNADLMLDDGSGITCGGVSLATEEGSEACEYVKDSLPWECCADWGDENDLDVSSLNPGVSNTVTEEEPAAEEDPEVGEESVEAIMDNDPIMHPLVDSKAAKVYAKAGKKSKGTKTASKSAKAFNGKGSKGTKAYSKNTKALNGKGSKASHLF